MNSEEKHHSEFPFWAKVILAPILIISDIKDSIKEQIRKAKEKAK